MAIPNKLSPLGTWRAKSKVWRVECSAGIVNIQTAGFQDLLWTFPDGTTSNAASINQTVTTGTLKLSYTGLDDTKSRFSINVSSAFTNSVFYAKDLPRVKRTLSLLSLNGLSGTFADLPSGEIYLQLSALPSLSGNTDSFSGATGYFNISDLPGLSGNASDLPGNNGEKRVYLCPNITGTLTVKPENLSIWYYKNNSVTPAEYDQTIQNVVDAGGLNGTLFISNTCTSASDANIATLQSRGWTVTKK